MQIKALHNQSVLDLLLQHTGSLSSALAFAEANQMSITDELEIGSSYALPDGVITDSDILNYYINNAYKPATGNAVVVINTDYGIGEMAIAQTFIIR
ncbi:hypothetical protein [Pedobacter sp.]|uniref:hypothetical protein n=1 Tax=Pedobacter sp. TaxID=1411316 RepID=UPI0031D6F0C9